MIDSTTELTRTRVCDPLVAYAIRWCLAVAAMALLAVVLK